ncbi:DNA repair protein RecN (Recombination protein N) [Arthrobacter silviterrae]|uniref:DNA repair protein RecN n=1 Tax=Arthrobacter silviterrae TaxID=2026658 RepID=A0ABX0D925_9MICC|nr:MULTISPECIES: DNA repair protein RecN [Arthrobacter]MCU6479117.1 DNA repair protein RecN [Arthrobacter sp. A2-55]MDQ0275704.1 DNA repair protein RecN (Recombination protein N) [Arthrobacter silviterrae]NGN83198.1 DNA repair protein RecN [Arthrobacter silviterrae]
MIEEIRIRDLGVISESTLPLGPGLSVVSGETGAGKTMVVTAVGLLLGNRADAGAVRNGAKSASAEATLTLPSGHAALVRAQEAGADIDEFDGGAELILARTVSADGRSRAHVGGRSAPIGVLAELGETLVAVHGQSDQIRLKSATAQREALDKFAAEAQKQFPAAMETYQGVFARWRGAQAELELLRTSSRERLREAESLTAALAEIDGVSPQPAEDELLKVEAVKLGNVEELRTASLGAHEALSAEDYGEGADAITLVDTAKRLLETVSDSDTELAELVKRVSEVGYLLADIARDLAGYATSLDSEGPGRLAEVEDRRGELAVLVRKYAPSIDEVLVWAEEARARLDELTDDTGRIERLELEVAASLEELVGLAAEVTKLRKSAAEKLSRQVSAELKALAMPDAKLVIELSPAERGIHGADDISFLLQPHAGALPRPLGKGASGGELSRVMLALEVVLAAVDPVPTFVFDEVDSGVGGKAAVEIGRRLAMLAKHVQVLVVTHLPQVAAFADQHILVTKSSVGKNSSGGITTSNVRLLDDGERVRELARMLAGQEDSATAQAHAKELLADARRATR